MDDLALAAGTDKSSESHNYTKVYSQYFKSSKDKPIRFLEIGIYRGDSVRFWENYFSKADLHFIDITNQYIQYYSPRSQYHFLDQGDIPSLKRFAAQQEAFDVILDDGGHTMEQQINSFLVLFSSVKPGGLYIIEDLHTSYYMYGYGASRDHLGRPGNDTAIAFLKNLIDDVNFPGAATSCANPDKLPAELKAKMSNISQHIESIRFYSSVCIIEKK